MNIPQLLSRSCIHIIGRLVERKRQVTPMATWVVYHAVSAIRRWRCRVRNRNLGKMDDIQRIKR